MKNIKLNLLIFIISFAFFGCSTVKNVPDDYTAPQIFQLGQEAYENQNYKASAAYYQIAIDRYGENTITYIEARYELGHTYLKLKKYENSYLIFKEILEFYEYDTGTLPSSYLKLANIGMSKIPEKKKLEFDQKYSSKEE